MRAVPEYHLANIQMKFGSYNPYYTPTIELDKHVITYK